jgi:hypothetical protein
MTYVHFRGLSFVVSVTFALRWVLLAELLSGSVFAEDAILVELRKKAEARADAAFNDAFLTVLRRKALAGDNRVWTDHYFVGAVVRTISLL